MIDTNQVIQAGQVVQTAKQEISPYLPALAVGAAWAGRELNRFAAWSAGAAEKIMAHGGIGKILVKLIWNKNV